MARVTHGACGKTWDQVGDRTSHCGGCHETFVSLVLFDAHRQDGKCLDASTMQYRGGPLAQNDDGVWWSPVSRDEARQRFESLRGTR